MSAQHSAKSGPHRVVLVPGDGIGPEVAEVAVDVLAATGVEIAWQEQRAGAEAFDETGSALPRTVIDAIREAGVALKGPIATPIGGGFKSANVILRQALDLYACERPVHNIAGLERPFQDQRGDIDLVIVRENTEGLYAGLEHQVTDGVVECMKVVTEKASLRIARYAFELATQQGRSRVCVIHKANIMKLSDGLFVECARRVAADFPAVELSDMIVDNCAMQLVRDPSQFDVMLLDNLYGDIMSDLCAGLVGGLGVVAGANFGDGCAVFEAVHGSAPDIAGKRLANPTALVLSAARMLEYLGERDAAARIERSVEATLADPRNHSADLGGCARLDDVRAALLEHLG